MAMKKIGATIAIDGEKTYRTAIMACNKATKEFMSEMQRVNAQYGSNASSTSALAAKYSVLKSRISTNKAEIKAWYVALNTAQSKERQAKQTIHDLSQEYISAKTKLNTLKGVYGATSKEAKEQAIVLKQLEKEITKSKNSYNRAKAAISECKAALNKARTAEIEMNAELKKLQTMLHNSTSVMGRFKNAAMETGSATERAATGALTFSSAIKSMVSVYAIIGSVRTLYHWITRVGGAMVDAGMDFEKSMSKVESLSGATSVEMQQLASEAREMGATTRYTATQSAEALTYMALAGWNAQQMLEGLPGIVYMAAASDMDLARASDILTDAMIALGDQTSESTRYADVLSTTQARTNTTVEQLGESFKYVAATAGSYHYQIEDLSAALGIMANSAIKGSSSGTYLSMIITRLANNTSGARDMLNSLGVDFYDVTGNARPLRDVLYELVSALENVNDEERATAVAAIAGKRAAEGLNSLIVQGADAYMSLAEQLDNAGGAAERIQTIMLDNLSGDVIILKSAVESLGITTYDVFDGTFRSAVQLVTESVRKLDKQIQAGTGIGRSIRELGKIFEKSGDQIARKFVSAIEFAIKALTGIIKHGSAIGTILKSIIAAMLLYKTGAVAINIATIAQAAFAVATGKANDEQKKLIASMMTNPYILLASAIAGVTVAITSFCVKASEARNPLREFNESVKETQEAMSSQIEANNSVTESWTESSAQIMAEAGVARDLVAELGSIQGSTMSAEAKQRAMANTVAQLNDLVPGLNLAIDEETGLLNKNVGELYNAIDAYEDYAKAVAAQEKLTDIAKEMLNTDIELFKAEEKLGEIEEELNKIRDDSTMTDQEKHNLSQQLWASYYKQVNAIDDLKVSEEELAGQQSTVEEIMKGSADAAGMTTGEVENLAAAATSASGEIEGASNTAQGAVDALAENIGEATSSAVTSFEKLSTGAETSLEELQENLDFNINAMSDWSTNLQLLADAGVNQGLLQTLAEAGPESATLVAELAKNIDPETGQMGEALRHYSETWEESTNLSEEVSQNVAATVAAAGEASQGFRETGENAVQEYKDGFSTGFEGAGTEALNVIRQTLNDAELRKASQESGDQIPEGIQTSVKNGLGKVTNSVSGIGTATNATARQSFAQSTYQTIGSNVTTGLANGISSGHNSVVSAIGRVAEAAVKKAKDTLKIQSPSKVFYDIGAYSIAGFTKGVDEMSFKASDAIANAMDFRVSTKAPSQTQQLGMNLSSQLDAIADRLPRAFVQALANSGLSFQCGEYEFGKLVRSVQ